MHVFFIYSCRKSFRELKNAIKKSIFPLFRGSGGQIKFLIKKKMGKHIGTGGLAWGKILGRLAFYTWVEAQLYRVHSARVFDRVLFSISDEYFCDFWTAR